MENTILLLDAKALAVAHSCSISSARRMLRNKTVPTVKRGRRTYAVYELLRTEILEQERTEREYEGHCNDIRRQRKNKGMTTIG